jgi:hypothetical protein
MEARMSRRDYAQEFACLAKEVAGIGQDQAQRFEKALRERFGGETARIFPRPALTLDRINAELRNRKPVAVIAAESGVSRATIYRYLKPKKSQSDAP